MANEPQTQPEDLRAATWAASFRQLVEQHPQIRVAGIILVEDLDGEVSSTPLVLGAESLKMSPTLCEGIIAGAMQLVTHTSKHIDAYLAAVDKAAADRAQLLRENFKTEV